MQFHNSSLASPCLVSAVCWSFPYTPVIYWSFLHRSIQSTVFSLQINTVYWSFLYRSIDYWSFPYGSIQSTGLFHTDQYSLLVFSIRIITVYWSFPYGSIQSTGLFHTDQYTLPVFSIHINTVYWSFPYR